MASLPLSQADAHPPLDSPTCPARIIDKWKYNIPKCLTVVSGESVFDGSFFAPEHLQRSHFSRPFRHQLANQPGPVETVNSLHATHPGPGFLNDLHLLTARRWRIQGTWCGGRSNPLAKDLRWADPPRCHSERRRPWRMMSHSSGFGWKPFFIFLVCNSCM